MKFVKVIIDGKEYYQKIEEAEEITAEAEPASEEYANAAESKEAQEELSGSEKFKRDTQEFFGRIGSGAKDFGLKIAEGAKVLGTKIKEGTERLFNKDKTIDPESTEAKLLRLLPYMSKDDAHEVCVKLLERNESLEKVNISAVMPFLTSEDCDAIFVRCIEINNTNYELATAIPYVSAKCLSKVVDNYIAGKYPELIIDDLYPFLSDADIKRIFYHIIGEEDKKSDT